VWDIVGYFQPNPLWYQMSYWCLTAGLTVALLAAVTGFLEYIAIQSQHPGMKTATTHMMLMLITTTLFGASWVLRAMSGMASAPTAWAIALAFIGVILLAIGGWLGGVLVYRHGIGQMKN
jgi:uncharacterized membrane protein